MKEVFHMNAKQVLFVVPDENDPCMGILIDHDYIICAECGGVFEFDEVFIIKTYDVWVNFEAEIADELDLLIAKDIGKELDRAESRKTDLWNNVRRSVQNYVMECGMIELFTEDYNSTLDADSFRIPGEINLLD